MEKPIMNDMEMERPLVDTPVADQVVTIPAVSLTAGKTEEALREALRVVIDPEIGMNVVELGLIRKLEIGDERGHVMMIMTTPFCPYAPQLLEQTRRAAQDYLGVPTTIEMGIGVWDPSMMEEGAADDWGLF